MWANAQFQLKLEPRPYRQFFSDLHFWIKVVAALAMNLSLWLWILGDFSKTSLNFKYKSAFTIFCAAFANILGIQVLHYAIRFDTDLSGIFFSVIGCFVLIPLGGEITAAILYSDEVIRRELYTQLFLVELAGFCLLFDTIKYSIKFLNNIEVIEVNIYPIKEVDKQRQLDRQ